MKNLLTILLLFPVLLFGQSISVTFTNQADFDAYNFISSQPYWVYLENDTTLPISEQINNLAPLSEVDTMVIILNHTLIEDLSQIQAVRVFAIAMEGNKNFDTLFIPDHVLSLSIECQSTYLKYIGGGAEVKQGGTFYIYDNDHLQRVDLDLGEMDSSNQGYPQLDVAQNDSLKIFIWGNPHHQLKAFSFFENRQLKHVHLETVMEKVSSLSESVGGFVFNIELDSISGCIGLDSVHSLFIKKNYMLENACVFQKGVDNYLVDHPTLEHFFVIEQNAIGLQSLNDLLNADCSWLPNGVEEIFGQEMALYPNPAHNEVFVEAPKVITNYRIYDMSGKTVKSGAVESNGRIGLQGISNGMYILHVNENRSKLVIQ